ncbi:MAG: ergothioneine biosynthesis glutamate--cysteine ligase EgtA, partial [Mycobacterium sp.]|nr:ergothioneine biosynthesis glutamate--cysteine ligase EgtA [Mycobacterium sp.]
MASAGDAAQHLVDGCLTPGPVGRVGLEIEAHCYDLAVPSRRPGWDELTAA